MKKVSLWTWLQQVITLLWVTKNNIRSFLMASWIFKATIRLFTETCTNVLPLALNPLFQCGSALPVVHRTTHDKGLILEIQSSAVDGCWRSVSWFFSHSFYLFPSLWTHTATLTLWQHSPLSGWWQADGGGGGSKGAHGSGFSRGRWLCLVAIFH